MTWVEFENEIIFDANKSTLTSGPAVGSIKATIFNYFTISRLWGGGGVGNRGGYAPSRNKISLPSLFIENQVLLSSSSMEINEILIYLP